MPLFTCNPQKKTLKQQYHEETEAKCDEEEHEDRAEAQEGGEHVGEHDHVDTQERQLADEEQQIHPRQEDGSRPNLPLPLLQERAKKGVPSQEPLGKFVTSITAF